MQLIYVIWAMIYRISQTKDWLVWLNGQPVLLRIHDKFADRSWTGTRLSEIARLEWRDALAEEIRIIGLS